MLVIILVYLVVFLIHFRLVNVLIHLRVFLINFFSSSSKYVYFTKSAISPLVAKFACFNLALKFLAVNLLNSATVMLGT